MYTLYKFHFLNGISEINQLFDDILIIWPAPVYTHTISSDWYFSKTKLNKYSWLKNMFLNVLEISQNKKK